MLSRRSLYSAAVVGLLIASTAAGRVAAPADAEEPTYKLPELRVEERPLQEFQFPTKEELQRSDFAPNTPPLDFVYPGRAYYDGVSRGKASVGVMLDRDGNTVDIVLLGYTRPYFGEALMEEVRKLKFTPRKLRGTAVPAPFIFTHQFRPPTMATNLSSFDAVDHRTETITGGLKFSYQPCRENEIDGGQLEPTRVAVPVIPPDYPASAKPPKVLVSFYVDEQGRVRLPNVESSTTPEFVTRAIAAVQQWAFKPATTKGEKTLVYTYRSLTFRPEPKQAASAPTQSH